MSSFCTAKATHIFSAKFQLHCKSYSHFFSKTFQHICVSLDANFNESLTNDVISFEQLGPDFQNKRPLSGCKSVALTSTHNLCIERKYEKYPNFLSENFHFLVVKFSVYLNRLVFVMMSGP